MRSRSIILLFVLAVCVCAAPAFAAKKKGTMSEQQQMSSDYAKAVELVNARKWKAGIEAMTAIIDNPKTSKDILPNAYADRGSCYANTKMPEEAVKDFDKSLELRPDVANTLYNRARALAMLNKHDAAIKDLTKAIELSQPSIIQAGYLYNRGVSYMAVDKTAEAKADFKAAKKLNPKLKIPMKAKDTM
ncbi:tetratricopeptide repeat protein [Fundidesulfovibrio agrisoli]|uniref:tetratricopeptide repeat protein n=1 Tax=Fundidesulfovibrio agrisoli TaxID=2922717 RepID=UPI001FAD2BD8|nr:tetratricopeptide repeat protein [Fundidesulfovibrio agrisoli]